MTFNEDVNCRVIGALESLDAYWAEALPAAGVELTVPEAELFEDSVATGCGDATSAVGPYLLPAGPEHLHRHEVLRRAA